MQSTRKAQELAPTCCGAASEKMRAAGHPRLLLPERLPTTASLRRKSACREREASRERANHSGAGGAAAAAGLRQGIAPLCGR